MKFQMNKTKLIARVLVLVLLVTSVLSFAGCGVIPYSWEVYSHAEFVKKIEKYNSINDGSIDTFISFNLDSNENVTQKMYCLKTVVNKTLRKKLGFVDILNRHYTIRQVFYLRKENNSHEFAYKIACKYDRIDNNFTEYDKIEITQFEHHCTGGYDPYYEATRMSSDTKVIWMYDHYYEYVIYVNDVEIGCIHISSIDEVSEEKLNEIIQMLYDSLVVINTKEWFVWRD